MSVICARLLGDLRSVECPDAFCVGGTREIFMPAIDVEGVGRLSFPVQPAQAERLVGVAEAAPHGRGEETLVDRDVRRTWQVDKARIDKIFRSARKGLAAVGGSDPRRRRALEACVEICS